VGLGHIAYVDDPEVEVGDDGEAALHEVGGHLGAGAGAPADHWADDEGGVDGGELQAAALGLPVLDEGPRGALRPGLGLGVGVDESGLEVGPVLLRKGLWGVRGRGRSGEGGRNLG